MKPRIAARMRRRSGIALALTVGLASAAAHAGCGVETLGVAFGVYDTLGGQALDGAGNVAVTCDSGVAWSIALSAGNGAYASRRLAGPVDALAYNLYTTAARLFVWGDGSSGTSTVAGSGNGSVQNVPVYGRIAGAQNVHSGAYADSIIVTVEF